MDWSINLKDPMDRKVRSPQMETRPCPQPTTHLESLPLGHCWFHALFSHRSHPTVALMVSFTQSECLQAGQTRNKKQNDFEHTCREQLSQVLWQRGAERCLQGSNRGLGVRGDDDGCRTVALTFHGNLRGLKVLLSFLPTTPPTRIHIWGLLKRFLLFQL